MVLSDAISLFTPSLRTKSFINAMSMFAVVHRGASGARASREPIQWLSFFFLCGS